MSKLAGSKTHQNLKDAFAGESQANRRYLYFANKADVEGQNDVAALFRKMAGYEQLHVNQILADMGWAEDVVVPRQSGVWGTPESPEVVPIASMPAPTPPKAPAVTIQLRMRLCNLFRKQVIRISEVRKLHEILKIVVFPSGNSVDS